MKKIFALLVFIGTPCCFGQNLSMTAGAGPQKCPVPTVPSTVEGKVEAPNGTVDLHSVIVTVEAALNCYQDSVGTGPDALPKLQKAVFDFKTTTGKIGGINISFFIFALKASKENDVTNDVSFTYSVPSTKPSQGHALLKKVPPTPLADAIASDLQAAALAVKESTKLENATFNQLSVQLTFGVVYDGSVSINAPVPLVTLGGSGEYKKNEAQSVTLTFAPPTSGL